MKRLTAILLALALLLSLCPAAMGGAEIPKMLEADAYIQDLCWVGDTLYALGNCTVYRWQPGETELSVFWQSKESEDYFYTESAPEDEGTRLLWETAFLNLFTDGASLYAWQPWSGQIFRLDGGTAVPIVKVPEELLTYELYGDKCFREVIQAEMQGNDLLLLLGTDDPENSDDQTLAAWNFREQKTMTLLTGGIFQLIPAGEGKVLLQMTDEENGGLTYRMLDTVETDGKSEMYGTNPKYDYSSAAFWQGQLVTCGDGKLVVCCTDGVEETAAYVPVYSGGKLACSAEGLCAAADGKNIFVKDLKEREETQILRVIGEFSPSLIQQFCLQNPGITVEANEPDGEDAILAALTGDAGADLFILNAPGKYTGMMEKGYLSSLDGSSKLREQVDSMYPAVRQALVSETGELFGYPISMKTESWTLDRTMWDEIQPGEVPVTFSEITDFLERWEEDYKEDWPDYVPVDLDGIYGLICQAVDAYIVRCGTEIPDFSTPEFTKLMREIVALKKQQEEADNMDGTPLIYTYEMAYGVTSIDGSKTCMIPMPALFDGEQPTANGSLEVLAVSAASGKKEEAIRFIEFCAEQQDPQTKYRLNPNLKEPVRKDNYEEEREELAKRAEDLKVRLEKDGENASELLKEQAEAAEKRLAELEDEWEISPESIANYQEIVQWLAIPHDLPLASDETVAEVIGDRIDEYYEEGLPESKLDAFLADLTRVCRMAIQEKKD